ncbi:hypothetical protein V5E97_00335 [Singulisphaera sp. Ch08]|uniref:Uncharacterized protein n=1 Tax=Singulisphaera sp. Ch08 TaxID=3120278 RepID=A0AAU7CH51_9BACT
MHPTLRHCLEATVRVASRLLPQGCRPPRAKARRRAAPELTSLEDRILQYFSVDATVVPSTLWPPNQRYVPVTLTGTLHEFSVVNGRQVFQELGGPKKANFQVTDEYRRDEPYGPMKLENQGGGKYTFSVTFHLQARRAEEFIAGRRYYLNVTARDIDGWAGKQLAVQVPRTLEDRGPGPLQDFPVRGHVKTNALGHPKAPRHGRMVK